MLKSLQKQANNKSKILRKQVSFLEYEFEAEIHIRRLIKLKKYKTTV